MVYAMLLISMDFFSLSENSDHSLTDEGRRLSMYANSDVSFAQQLFDWGAEAS